MECHSTRDLFGLGKIHWLHSLPPVTFISPPTTSLDIYIVITQFDKLGRVKRFIKPKFYGTGGSMVEVRNSEHLCEKGSGDYPGERGTYKKQPSRCGGGGG